MGFNKCILVICNTLYYTKYGIYKDSRERHGISLVKLVLGQETRDLSAMVVQQGNKLSFTILYGHSRLDRPNENCSKMVGYVTCTYSF